MSSSVQHSWTPGTLPFFVRAAVRAILVALFVAGVGALLGVATAAPASAQDAEIVVLHAIPGVEVELWGNDEPLITNFTLGDREDLSILAGEIIADLEVRSASTGAVIIRSQSGSDQLPSTGSWTIVAHLDADGQPRLSVFPDEDSSVPAGEGRLTVRHVADTDFIDVYVDNDPFGDGIDNADQVTKPFPAGSYEVMMIDANGDLFVDPIAVPLTEGESIILYAVGSEADDPLTIEQDRTIPNDAADPDPADDPEPDPTPVPEPTADGFVMAETSTNSSAPGAVDTGIGPLAVTRISWSRTFLAGALGLAAVTLTTLFVRRRGDSPTS